MGGLFFGVKSDSTLRMTLFILHRAGMMSGGEMSVDFTELKPCNQDPLSSGTASQWVNTRDWHWFKKVFYFLNLCVWCNSQTSKTIYWRREIWPKTAIRVSSCRFNKNRSQSVATDKKHHMLMVPDVPTSSNFQTSTGSCGSECAIPTLLLAGPGHNPWRGKRERS